MARKIKTINEQVVKTQSIKSDCRSITFEIQTGSADCFIDNYPLVINRPYSINLYPGEINTTVYQVKFSGVGTRVLFVTREFETE